MPVREQSAFSGVRCCFSCLINTLFLPSTPNTLFIFFYPCLPLSPIPLGGGMQISFISPFCHSVPPVYWFIFLLIWQFMFMQSGSETLYGHARMFWIPVAIKVRTNNHSEPLEVSQNQARLKMTEHCCFGKGRCEYTGTKIKACWRFSLVWLFLMTKTEWECVYGGWSRKK